MTTQRSSHVTDEAARHVCWLIVPVVVPFFTSIRPMAGRDQASPRSGLLRPISPTASRSDGTFAGGAVKPASAGMPFEGVSLNSHRMRGHPVRAPLLSVAQFVAG